MKNPKQMTNRESHLDRRRYAMREMSWKRSLPSLEKSFFEWAMEVGMGRKKAQKVWWQFQNKARKEYFSGEYDEQIERELVGDETWSKHPYSRYDRIARAERRQTESDNSLALRMIGGLQG